MGIAEDARVTLLLGDYLGVDAGGKVNGIGIGFSLIRVQGNGLTDPFHLMALIDLPPKYAGEEFAFSFELRSVEPDTAFKIPGPSGTPEPLRIQQVVRGERPIIPGVFLPAGLPIRVQVGLALIPGLPLTPGRNYIWRPEIDGQHSKSWDARFHVIGPPPPVIGGLAGPTDISGIQPPSA